MKESEQQQIIYFINRCLDIKANKKFIGTKYEFIKFAEHMNRICMKNTYIRRLYLPQSAVINYLYSMRADNAFMRQTAHIHKRADFIYLDYYCKPREVRNLLQIKLWLAILNININENTNQNTDPAADLDSNKHIYTYKEQVKIRAEFKRRWEEKKCADSLNLYAFCLEQKIGASDFCVDEMEAIRLYKLNWEQNKYSLSLINYVNYLHRTYKCISNDVTKNKIITEIYRLLKLSWKENKCADSLCIYAYRLEQDTVGVRNDKVCEEKKAMARKLYKLNWEENKHSWSLHAYALCLRDGIGGPQANKTREKEKAEARRLFKLSWEENKYIHSLYCYVNCLNNGIGGPKDTVEATRLTNLNNVNDDWLI